MYSLKVPRVDEREVKRRASLLQSGMGTGRVKAWCEDKLNRMLLRHYCYLLKEAMETDDRNELQLTWGLMLSSSQLQTLFKALGPYGREIRRRGMQGDERAIKVFYCLISGVCCDPFFMPDCGDEQDPKG